MIVDVALNIPVARNWSYLAPEGPAAPVGCRVEVVFGGRRLAGFVVATRDKPPEDLPPGVSLQPVRRFIDREPVCPPATLELARWLSGYYFCSLGQALSTMIPSGRRGKPAGREPRPARDAGAAETLMALNAGQRAAADAIIAGLAENGGRRFLLHGVTGSGKTEVYRHVAAAAVAAGRQVVILVPEIALTPQTTGRFASLFDEKIAILHSRLTPAERISEWRRIARREAVVVIGARSAVFAPVAEGALFIIDEEHETSYKADDCPRYHARQVAFHRAGKTGCLVLGSATPAVETLHHASTGALTRLVLDERIAAHARQEIVILDLRREPAGALVAPPLVTAIREAVARGEQALLFLNRRGYSQCVTCDDCGKPVSCPNCSISLTLHRAQGILLCHYCGHTVRFENACPVCGGTRIRSGGAGTERAVEFLAKRLPGLRVGRLDSDTTGGQREVLFEMLEAFARKELDVLVGTQMIAKGLDFPDLTVVGILAADNELTLPDFRSFERVHNQLLQVIGRCGRADKKGTAFIQTAMPGEDPIASLLNRDSEGFFKRELGRRQECAWPPWSRLIRLVLRSTDPDAVAEAAAGLAARLIPLVPAGCDLLGPVPCPVERRAQYWRHHMLLRGPALAPLAALLQKAGLAEGSRGKVYLEIDVDPQSML